MKQQLFDLTNIVFGNEAQLEKILENYPVNSNMLVTGDQRSIITGFKTHCTRYIDMTSQGMRSDVLVFDNRVGSYRIFTGRVLDGVELTEEKE